MATPQHPINNLFTILVCVVDGCFFPWRGTNDGKLGLNGGLGLSKPLLLATFGLSKVADVMDGLSCEYDAVDPTVSPFGFRRACIFLNFCVAWLSILPEAAGCAR